MGPGTNAWGNEFPFERPIKPRYLPVPDLETAPLGVRLRFLRKRRGLTISALEKATGVSHNAISALERAAVTPEPRVLARILAFFAHEAAAVFPGKGDVFDRIIPPTSPGAWLANLRLRKGLRQRDLARIMGVSKVAVWKYEHDHMKPPDKAIRRLEKAFGVRGPAGTGGAHA